MENEIIKLDFAALNKGNAKTMAMRLAEVVEQGVVAPLDAFTRLKAIETMVTEARKLINDLAKNDLSKYDKSEKIVFNGYELSQRECAPSYDFEACKDNEWHLINDVIENHKLILKERETFLKSLKKPLDMVDEDGVCCTIYPPVKKSTTSIICS